MGSMEGGQTPIVEMKKQHSPESGEQRRSLNSELWHACAGPLVSLPQVGSLAYYFPQGHCQQVAASSRNMTANSQIPNYPNLPCQLLCQVQNVTLHADNETDEIFAKMSLQPLDSETDVFSISEIGPRPSKHPGVFFCKTLTASDTSTHGGFSVPRRAAERIFPPLDYTIKPPTQELVVRDLHDNTWTFRHIYRGQPKRHLLTTGWSLFVSTKRLKAGDSVLFIRDEKSQLLVGVRRGSRQQTTLPSSLLSADSMHIGVLAAAAHAAANRSPFTIFYNPRACPSEFVIPLAKYKRAVYGTQLSTGLRFSMMFETEESCKRRYMGTIVGISDLDPLRWPGSKWQNIQVKWDEPGCSDKQKRVSSWDVETLETLPIFPSLTSSLKRPLQSAFLDNGWSTLLHWPSMRVPEIGTLECSNTMQNLYPKQVKTLMKPQLVDNNGTCLWVTQQEFAPKRGHFEEVKTTMPMDNQNVHHASAVSILQEGLHVQTDPGQYTAFNLHSSFNSDQPENLHPPEKNDNSMSSETVTEKLKLEPEVLSDHIFDFTILEGCNIEKLDTNPVNPQCLAGQLTLLNQNQSPSPSVLGIPQSDSAIVNGLLPQLDTDEWMVHSSCQPLAGENTFTEPLSGLQEQSVAFSQEVNLPLSSVNQDMWDPHVKNLISEQGQSNLNCMTASDTLRDLLAESNNQSEIWDNASADINSVSASMVDPCTSSAIVDEFCTLKDGDFQNPSGCMVSSFSMSQDVQSQITSASLASSSHVDFDGSSFLQNNSWPQVAVQPPRKRTYTKVQKAGSVGRSIDVTTFKNYEELIHAIECMFGLKGLLNDSRGSGWKLVYLDYENDVLLVGDDPWGEFVGCVRCIRILSPTEVQQMSEEGMKLLNSGALKGITGRMSEGCT